MENNELLQKLNFLIKEINETHNRLQRAKENFQEIEVALLTQQVVNLYQHLQRQQDNFRKSRLQSNTQLQPEPATHQVMQPKPTEPKTPIEEKQETVYVQQPTQEPVKPIQTPSAPETEMPIQSPVAEQNNEVNIQLQPTTTQEEFIRKEEKAAQQKPTESQIATPIPPDQVFEPTPKNKTEVITSAGSQRTMPYATPTEEKQEKPLHEKLPTETRSINERFAQQQVKKNLADKLKLSPIKDIKSAMSLNQRVAFQKNLFLGNEEEFRKAVNFINELKSFSEAKFYLQSEITPKYNWDEENQLVQEFMELVYRKFL